MRPVNRCIGLLLLALSIGCSQEPEHGNNGDASIPPDASGSAQDGATGLEDAAPEADAGLPCDAGPPADADVPDADVPDADVPDADVPDADVPDAAPPWDGGMKDPCRDASG